MHKIFINLDFKQNISTVIEIEKVITNGIKEHLINQQFNGCSIEQMRQYIAKYNSIFNIDSSTWFETEPTTDIFIRSEIKDKKETKTVLIFYDKKSQNLRYNLMNISKIETPKKKKKCKAK